jgi:outer membrane beta-barrel protein
MDSRLRILFLAVLLCVNAIALAADKQSGKDNTSLDQIIQQEPVIQPKVKRKNFNASDIGTNNFELTPFAGFLSIEDFGVKPVYGFRLDYHVSEDFFFEGSIGKSKAGTTSYERLSGGVNLLTDSQRDYTYYDVTIGYNLLPGEGYFGRHLAYNTSLYLVAGAGATKFAGDNRFTVTWGGGYRINITDWFATHLDFRDHIFSIDVTGAKKNAHNFEATLGLTYIF